jgi:hypothetical protein
MRVGNNGMQALPQIMLVDNPVEAIFHDVQAIELSAAESRNVSCV